MSNYRQIVIRLIFLPIVGYFSEQVYNYLQMCYFKTKKEEKQEFSDDDESDQYMSSLGPVLQNPMRNSKNKKKNKSKYAKKVKVEEIPLNSIRKVEDSSKTVVPQNGPDNITTTVQELDHEPRRPECSHSVQIESQFESFANEGSSTAHKKVPEEWNTVDRTKGKNKQNKGQPKRNGFESYRYNRREEFPQVKAVPGVCGLQNLGNTCYMNSAIQCLSNIELLTDFAKEFAKMRSNVHKNNRLIDNYCRLIDNMWSGKRNSIAPDTFKASVGKHLPNFSGYGQKDCAELLTSALSCFHEELLKSESSRTNQYMDYNTYEDFLQNNNTFIAQNFYAFQRFQLTCDCGELLLESFDPILVLNLPYTKKERGNNITLNIILIRNTGELFKIDLQLTDNLIKVKQLKQSLIRSFKNAKHIELSENNLILCQVIKAQIVNIFMHQDDLLFLDKLKDQVYVYEKEPDLEQVFIELGSGSEYFGVPMLLNVNNKNLETIREEFCSKLPSILKSLLNVNESELLQSICFTEGNGMFVSLGIEIWTTDMICNSIRRKYGNPLKSMAFHNIISTKRQDFDSYIKLEESLDNYISLRNMNSSDKLYCSQCSRDTSPNEQMSVVFAPNVLILQLKTNPKQQLSSHESRYQFPLVLDFKPFVLNSEKNDLLYDLNAISNYSGNAYSGHYTASAKNVTNGQWYAFNDSYVEKVSQIEQTSSRAYLLFYVKREIKQ